MDTKFIINEPKWYHSNLDEHFLFKWLESVPSVRMAILTEGGIALTLKLPLDEPNLRDLIAVMTRYDIDRKCLRELCDANNESWFKNKETYWYKSVFE